MVFKRNTCTQQQLTRAGFGLVAAEFGIHRFQVGCAHVVVVGGFGVGIQGIPFCHRGPHFLVAHHDHIQHAVFFKRKLILAQLAQAHIGLDDHSAAAGLQVAPQNFHESGFAAAVCANQTIAVAIAKFGIDVFKKQLGAELHGDIGCGEHKYWKIQ